MKAIEKKQRINRLNSELKKSLSGIKLSSSKKVSLMDKIKIKRAAKKGIRKFFSNEIKRVKTYAFDWYFDYTLGRVYRQRNGTNKNRYFIVEFSEVISLNAMTGTRNQRTREIFTSDAEFSAVVSSSEKLFAKLFDITVDAKERKKIWNAYDSVDEKAIFAVTLGIPLAIIFIAEIAPVVAVEAELISSATNTVLKEYVASSMTTTSIFETSAYNGLVNGGTNLAGQYVANDFKMDQNINWAQPVFAGVTRGLVSNLGESTFDLRLYYDKQGTFDTDFKLSDGSTFYSTFFSNILGNEVSGGFSNLTKPVNAFTPVFKSTFDIIGGTVIEVGENKVGEEIKSVLN